MVMMYNQPLYQSTVREYREEDHSKLLLFDPNYLPWETHQATVGPRSWILVDQRYSLPSFRATKGADL